MKKNFIFSAVAAVLMLSFVLAPTSGFATFYSTWSSRGIENISYIKNIVSWKTDDTKIVTYDTRQKVSGVQIKACGISKEKSRSTKTRISLLCKMDSFIGVSICGVNVGWTKNIHDRVYIYRSGTACWYYDV